MLNMNIRDYFTLKHGALFEKMLFSTDNAFGIAILIKLRVVNG